MTPQHPLFVAIDNLLGEPLSIKDLVLTERFLQHPAETVAQENDGAASWGLTICSGRLDTALRSEKRRGAGCGDSHPFSGGDDR
ncbi:hypothetical protein KCP77_06620 [Salmonella enterica subsp. enterica]|nr:hypothetical protein KCP77_06620 [Salmonella enterica subsp. enterica]